MKMRTLGFLAATVVGLAVGASAARATTIDLTAGSTTLDVLLTSGNDATVGNLVFTFDPTTFSSVATGGSAAPTAAQIIVSAFTSVPGEPGLLFQANWNVAGTNQTVDTRFDFTVTTLDGSGINDDYLSTTGSALFSSSWAVSEQVTNAAGATLANIDQNLVAGSPVTTLVSVATFAPESILKIHKDISLSSNNDTGVAHISDVSQGFSVPVPAAAWMGLSTLGGLGVMSLLRKRR